MRKSISVLFIAVVVIFSACSKSADSGNNNGGNNGGGNNPTPPPNYLLHTSYTVQHNSTGAVTNSEGNIYNYDKANNSLTIYRNDTISGLAYPDTLVYTLSGDVITAKYKKALITQTYYLHTGHNYADSMVIVNGSTINHSKYEYTFDGAGKIATQKATQIIYSNGFPSTPEVTTTTYTWQNGNITTITNSSFTYTATFDANTLVAAPDPIMNLISPLSALLIDKNTVKTASAAFGSLVQNLTFTYDDKGRIIKETNVDTAGDSSTLVETYY